MLNLDYIFCIINESAFTFFILVIVCTGCLKLDAPAFSTRPGTKRYAPTNFGISSVKMIRAVCTVQNYPYKICLKGILLVQMARPSHRVWDSAVLFTQIVDLSFILFCKSFYRMAVQLKFIYCVCTYITCTVYYIYIYPEIPNAFQIFKFCGWYFILLKENQ